MPRSKENPSGQPSLEERLSILAAASGFEGVPRDHLLPLAKAAKSRVWPRNQYIFLEGDPASEFHVVASGRVRLCKTSTQGKVFTTTVADRGDTLNAVVLFDSQPRFLSAQALEDTHIVYLPAEVFVSFVAAHPEVALAIITILGKVAQSIFERTLDIISERVEQRVINILFMLYDKFGNPINVTNRELADLAGTTTETTIRVMGQLAQAGMIKTSRGQINIISPSHLQTRGRGPFWA